MYETALSILKKINDLGYQAYIVGGYARDTYLHQNSDDIDICSNIKESVLFEQFNILSKSNYGSFIIEENKYTYELTLFRKEVYDTNRFPEVTYIDSLEEDLKRRDFIINTLCINQLGEFVDVMGAKKDLDKKIIRVVGDIEIKLKEDPLRMIRAIRFASDLDFTLEENLYNFIKVNHSLLTKVTKKRLKKEIEKVKNKEKFNNFIILLDLLEDIQ